MREYQGTVPINKKQLTFTIFGSIVFAVGFALFILIKQHGNVDNIDSPSNFTYLPIAIVAIVMALSFYYNYKKLSRLSLYIQLTDRSINAKVEGHYDITIDHMEIEAIRQQDNGDLIIKGTQKFTGLLVPQQMEGYTEIKAQLAQWHPIELVSKAGPIKKNWKPALKVNIVSLVCYTVFFFMLFSTNPIFIVFSAAITISFGVMTFYRFKKLEGTITLLKNLKWASVFVSVIALVKALMVLLKPEMLNA